MKKCLIILFLFSSLVYSKYRDKLIAPTGIINEPLEIIDTDNSVTGFDFDILRMALNSSGIKLDYYKGSVPWDRHLLMIKEGQLDVGVASSWVKERASYAYYSFPYRNEYIALYVRNEDENKYHVQSLDDLLGLDISIGVKKGFSYGGKVDRLIEKLGDRIEWVHDNEQNYNKLVNNRIDAILSYPLEHDDYVNELGLTGKLKLVENSVTTSGKVYFILSKSTCNIETLDKLNEGLVQIETNGKLDSLINFYSQKYPKFKEIFK
ncbi:MAG: transporter substrate-binding domain-containing protein [Candidatus Delongbacteria bacterium]|nr:transporter substrate-binding domain-containing protein [Candidatus Delongbacteria bacterium]MBN2833341.1 transporter substrate-binding domain-containing protein [Candidatus Delongbacteria bacterium]